MSYCRWSSTNSDLYVYGSFGKEGEDCYIAHVAGRRRIGSLPHEDSEILRAVQTKPSRATEMLRENRDALSIANYENLPEPSTGGTFSTSTPGEMAAKLKKLVGEGFHVPDHAITRLRTEERARVIHDSIEK